MRRVVRVGLSSNLGDSTLCVSTPSIIWKHPMRVALGVGLEEVKGAGTQQEGFLLRCPVHWRWEGFALEYSETCELCFKFQYNWQTFCPQQPCIRSHFHLYLHVHALGIHVFLSSSFTLVFCEYGDVKNGCAKYWVLQIRSQSIIIYLQWDRTFLLSLPPICACVCSIMCATVVDVCVCVCVSVCSLYISSSNRIYCFLFHSMLKCGGRQKNEPG